MSFRERLNILVDKINKYLAGAPEREKKKYENRKERDNRKLEELKLKTSIEKEKTEIEKQRISREMANLKLNKERDRTKPSFDIPIPLFMAEKKSKKDFYDPFTMRTPPSLKF